MSLRLEDIERMHVSVLAAAGGVAYVTAWVSAPSLLLGGAVMGANLWILRQLGVRLLVPRGHRRRLALVGLALAKLALFLGLLTLLFWRVPVDGLAFAIGASLLPVACLAMVLGQHLGTADCRARGS